MSDDVTTVAIEQVLAAIIDQQDGLVRIDAELFSVDRGGKVIAIDYDSKTNTILLSLAESDDIDYDV